MALKLNRNPNWIFVFHRAQSRKETPAKEKLKTKENIFNTKYNSNEGLVLQFYKVTLTTFLGRVRTEPLMVQRGLNQKHTFQVTRISGKIS